MTDRRVRRTRELLSRALLELTLEKGYQRVTVQDILDRADIGRSTFYAHYQSKDDLLLSGYDELRAAFAEEAERDPGELLSPARALLRFVDGRRALYEAIVLTHELVARPVRSHLETVFLDHLRPRLRVTEPELTMTTAFVVNALTGLIAWWVGNKSPLTADEVYARFRSLATTGIEPLLMHTSARTAQGDQFV
jgi:AcrR family transcriptional regulator